MPKYLAIPTPLKEEKIQETLPAEEETNLVDDLELIAVITAAIAASEGGDPGQYIVRSIKKGHRNHWSIRRRYNEKL